MLPVTAHSSRRVQCSDKNLCDSVRSHPGRRVVAICGKDGVGKTAFSALAAHSLMHCSDTVFIDGEAGLEQTNRQVVSSVDDLIVVSDGSLRGLKTVTSVVS